MKLIALKRISDRRPLGCIFDEPNPRAKMLVAIGLAKPYVEPPPAETVEKTTDATSYTIADEAATVEPNGTRVYASASHTQRRGRKA